MESNLDLDTKISLLERNTIGQINDVLDEYFQLGQLRFIDKWVRDPNNKWKQERVDKAINLLDEYREKRANLIKEDKEKNGRKFVIQQRIGKEYVVLEEYGGEWPLSSWAVVYKDTQHNCKLYTKNHDMEK